jgi:hypothetical protein
MDNPHLRHLLDSYVLGATSLVGGRRDTTFFCRAWSLPRIAIES